MSEGRRSGAGLQLLDRQLIAHEGRLRGTVDDLELMASDDGDQLYVSGSSRAGRARIRLGRRRFGRWLRRRTRARVDRRRGSDPRPPSTS